MGQEDTAQRLGVTLGLLHPRLLAGKILPASSTEHPRVSLDNVSLHRVHSE